MCLPRSSRNNGRGGFTYAEFLVAGAITVILASAALAVFVAAERATATSHAKLSRTAEARRAIDWIVRDVRQAVSWELSTFGAPASNHIKFRKVDDWDMVNNTTFLLSNNYTEYTYYASNDTLIRQLLDLSNNTLQTHFFRNITDEPFYMYDASFNVVDLNSSLGSNATLIIRISSEEEYKPNVFVNTTLESEVRLRNG